VDFSCYIIDIDDIFMSCPSFSHQPESGGTQSCVMAFSLRLYERPNSHITIFIRRYDMGQYQIAVVVGSLRRDSFNRKLADALIKLAPPEFTFKYLNIGDLPLYNQDDDGNQAESVKRLKAEIAGAQGLLFVTPEYNRSMPGVLKNALDHASRPYGQNAWAGKPGGVIGASIGSIGTAIAQQHLRNSLAYLDVPTLGQPEAFIHVKEGLFDKDGNIGNEDSRKFLQNWMNRYVDWVKRHAIS
jgi:chromate reductase